MTHKIRIFYVTVIWFYWRLPFCFNLDKEHRPAPSSGNKDLKHGKNGFDLPVFGPGLNLYCVVYRAKLTVFGSVLFSDNNMILYLIFQVLLAFLTDSSEIKCVKQN